jgi:hypothetical protein
LHSRLHSQIIGKRQEQNLIIEKANTVKYNSHRNMLEDELLFPIIKIYEISSGKISEQCANLTMAFRTNYHAYV